MLSCTMAYCVGYSGGDACTNNMCQNGAACVVKGSVLYACECKAGYSGSQCQTGLSVVFINYYDCKLR